MKFLNLILPLLFISCAKLPDEDILKSYPADDLSGVISSSGIEADQKISADGRGSLRMFSESPNVFTLYEAGDIDIEDAVLSYTAKIKTENVQGQVYLEMWCAFPGGGEYFSRGLDQALAGTNDWKEVHTDFFLRSGENPINVRLNVVFAGGGTVWVDDIRISKK